MKAIIDILKENGLYTFMDIKEKLLVTIEEALAETEYNGKYGLSGSFTSTDQTISIVVGILAERQMMGFISSGTGGYTGRGTPAFREYTYGINITGINDEEVKNLSKHVYYHIINRLPDINRAVKARVHSDLFMQPLRSSNVGEKRMWSVNIFASAAVNEVYLQKAPPARTYDGDGLNADGYVPPDYSSCITISTWPEGDTNA